MSSENRNKFKKRKREPHINSRRQKDEEEDDDDDDAAAVNADDDGEQDEDYDLQPNPNPNPNPNPVPSLLSRESEVVSGEGERLSSFPPVVKRLVNRFHSSVLNIAALERALERGEIRNMPNPPVLENVSYGQLQALSSVPADCLSYGGDDQERAFVITPPAIMEGKGVIKHVRNEQPHVVPMHSDWFSLGTIHRLERQNVPNFFSGRSASFTPEKYMECRNRIVAMYVQNPEKRLLAANCHGLFSGVDPEDVNRIVRFLDNWGIINYCAASSPIRELLNPSSSLREDVDGELHVPSTALKSISSLIKFDKPQCRLKPRDVYASSSSNHEDEIPDLDSRIREQLTENRCFHCLQSIPIIYYQSQKEADTLLCSDCFHEGVFVTGHSSIDFVKMDSTKEYNDVDGESWTDQEILLLLEAMEMYNENWNDIADHVGSKSKAQCIIQFIRMPMEGGRLENIDVPKVSMSSDVLPRHSVTESHSKSNGHLTVGTCHSNTDSDSKLPFLSSGNPAMALVSFLAAAVGPRVAAACAHACLAVLCDTDGSVSPSNKNPEDSVHGSGSVPENAHGNLTKSNLQTDEALKLGGRPVSAEKVKSAAEAGLAAAALKAKVFGDHEEREIQRLSANIINHQLKRLELKLKQFAEVETLLMKECEQVEKSRQRLAAERTRIISSRFGTPGMASPPSMLATNLVNNNAGPSRQTVISPTPSQPGINYGNNQMMHPHMSFVPNQQQHHPSQQQMFGFGPRLPLNAIQPPSSVHNVMFNNTSSNSQHNLGHPMLRPVSNANSGLS